MSNMPNYKITEEVLNQVIKTNPASNIPNVMAWKEQKTNFISCSNIRPVDQGVDSIRALQPYRPPPDYESAVKKKYGTISNDFYLKLCSQRVIPEKELSNS